MQSIEWICSFIAASAFTGVVATAYLLAKISGDVARIAKACDEDAGLDDPEAIEEAPKPARRSSLQIGIQRRET